VGDTHPPVREALEFDGFEVVIGFVSGRFVVVWGTQPDHLQVALEDDPAPAIPEREWIPWDLVGYHFGEYVPDPQPFKIVRQVPEPPPPGAKGIEIVGKSKRVQVPLW
jgi:hypothetical protein